jgi:hypothetical protein
MGNEIRVAPDTLLGETALHKATSLARLSAQQRHQTLTDYARDYVCPDYTQNGGYKIMKKRRKSRKGTRKRSKNKRKRSSKKRKRKIKRTTKKRKRCR